MLSDHFPFVQGEWEALEISDHKWVLENIEESLIETYHENLAIYADFKDKDI